MTEKVMDYLNEEAVNISKPLRLGKKRENGKPRLLKEGVDSVGKKKGALSEAKQLRNFQEVDRTNV